MRALAIYAALLFQTSVTGCSTVDPFAEEKAAVANRLKDPASAQFREVKRCGTSNIVTGEMNGKNLFGAYSGFTIFFTDGVLAAAGSDDLLWNSLSDACNEGRFGDNWRDIVNGVDDADIERQVDEMRNEIDRL